MALNIYLLFFTIIDNNTFKKFYLKLPNKIQNKIIKYHFLIDKWRTLLSELFIRKILSDELNVALDDLDIYVSYYKKPYLKNFKRQFNLSHSNNAIILATDDYSVGIDIEQVNSLENLNFLISHFSKKEQKDFFSKKKEKQLDFFFSLWTLKESYIKAIGKGFHYPLSSFSIDIKKENISIIDHIDSNESWYFKCYKIPNYKIAVCAQHNQFPKNLKIVKTSELLQLLQ